MLVFRQNEVYFTMEFYLNNEQSLNEILKNCHDGDIVHLASRVYYEKIKITIPNLTIIGHNSSIEYKDYYNKIAKDNKELLTVRTYTLMVEASNVTLKNLTIKNLSVPNRTYGQAVALHVIGDSFKAIACNIIGAQDTILAGPIPYDLTIRYKDLLPLDELSQAKSHQLYDHCYIEGDVDFIFGCGICYFNECEIHSIGKGYICAPSHPKEYSYGFVFYKCRLTGSDEIKNRVYLGRPWRDYGQACFISCQASSHIKPEGYHYWQESRKETCRLSIYETLNEKDLASFVKVLDSNDLNKYTLEKVMKG